jgi:hypothetical protein
MYSMAFSTTAVNSLVTIIKALIDQSDDFYWQPTLAHILISYTITKKQDKKTYCSVCLLRSKCLLNILRGSLKFLQILGIIFGVTVLEYTIQLVLHGREMLQVTDKP